MKDFMVTVPVHFTEQNVPVFDSQYKVSQKCGDPCYTMPLSPE